LRRARSSIWRSSTAPAASYAAAREERGLALELLAIEQPTLDRAVEVQAALAERGDLIATIIGQSVEWVVPRGSV
jgi:hypothetical protein